MRICSEIREELSPADDDSGALLDLSSATLPDWSAALRGLGAARLLDGDAAPTPVATPGATPGTSPNDAAASEQSATRGGHQAASGATAPADLAGQPSPAPQRPEDQVVAAIYISCAGRGGPHFGAPSAELEIVRHALGDVPLIGFFAGGEIARHHLYGYTGVLTVLRNTPA
jgi:hypothetical protein